MLLFSQIIWIWEMQGPTQAPAVKSAAAEEEE